jgi:hypothetical protein
MSCEPIQILQNPDSIEVKTYPTNIQILQGVNVIKVCSQNPVSQFQPFSFTATVDNQTTFGPLPQPPLNIITLAITGTLQDPAGTVPDYTLDDTGLNIILSQGIAAGNTVYGIYQVA